jgi:Holliday junction resolvasome RuvABC endonuclease subunit
LILGVDAAWGACGWAVVDGLKLVDAGVIKPSKAGRVCSLLDALEAGPGRHALGLAVVEWPGRHDGLHGGGDVTVVRALGQIAGAVGMWAAARGLEPFMVEPEAWRRVWGIHGHASAKGKALAVQEAKKAYGIELQHDAAEAALIAGAAERMSWR